jgi:hypothetical protein
MTKNESKMDIGQKWAYVIKLYSNRASKTQVDAPVHAPVDQPQLDLLEIRI